MRLQFEPVDGCHRPSAARYAFCGKIKIKPCMNKIGARGYDNANLKFSQWPLIAFFSRPPFSFILRGFDRVF
jgi:hypothetical protein